MQQNCQVYQARNPPGNYSIQLLSLKSTYLSPKQPVS